MYFLKITPAVLDTIRTRIVDAIQPERIVLFGSHAWGTPNDDSDVDLYIVVAKTEQPAYKLAREVYKALRGLNVPIDVVIQTHEEAARSAKVATSLARKVADDGIVLFTIASRQ